MPKKTLVYIGTYTDPIKFGTGQILDGKGEGIYLLALDNDTGNLRVVDIFPGITNPSYLALSPGNRFLYAVNELKEYQGKPSGSVSAFKVDKNSGAISFINKQPTLGTDPCHVAVNPGGTHIFVSNFMSGSVSVFPIQPDGGLGEPSQFIQHNGSSVDPNRQAGPHAHSLVFSPDGRFAYVPDLGLDRLVGYTITPGDQPLQEAEELHFDTRPGAGPRHCTFSPDGRYCYLINELDSTIVVLKFSAQTGGFTKIQTVSSLPAGLDVPGNTCADVHITPDGRFLYGSNRGHNSLIIYEIDEETGTLSFVDCPPCGGQIPRNFAIEPAGKYLLCANQDSDDIVVFEINAASGKLAETARIEIPTPVCVKPLLF